jgi:hypothetical protein
MAVVPKQIANAKQPNSRKRLIGTSSRKSKIKESLGVRQFIAIFRKKPHEEKLPSLKHPKSLTFFPAQR